MGRKENPLLWYYHEHTNFAELIDGWLFHGKGQIRAEQAFLSHIDGETAFHEIQNKLQFGISLANYESYQTD